jgi:hypothetical protein
MQPKTCKICFTPLMMNKNWYKSNSKNRMYYCNDCYYQRTDRYIKKHHSQKLQYQKDYRIKNHTKIREYFNNWLVPYSYDWLHLQLGNKCLWCDRSNQEISLDVDHVIPKLRGIKRKSSYRPNNVWMLIKDFESGDELRLLCIQCHRVRHAI